MLLKVHKGIGVEIKKKLIIDDLDNRLKWQPILYINFIS